MSNIKIYKMTENEWVAAESYESAKALIKDIYGEDADEYMEDGSSEPLTDDEMNTSQLYSCNDNDEPDFRSPMVSYRKSLDEMIARSFDFPIIFASSED